MRPAHLERGNSVTRPRDRQRCTLCSTVVLLVASVAALAGVGAGAAAFLDNLPLVRHEHAAKGAVEIGDRDLVALDDAAVTRPPLASGRRSTVVAGLAAMIASPLAASAAEPKVTAQCALDVKIAAPNGGYTGQPLRRIVIGLFGNESPILTRSFMQACSGTYPGKAGRSARFKLANFKAVSTDRLIQCCKFPGGDYLEEVIDKNGGRDNPGNVRKIPLAGPETKTTETNSLRHDKAGRVSMSMGGGSFNFLIAPTADGSSFLDKDHVVVGQVIEGMDVVDDINKIKSFLRGGIINAVDMRNVDFQKQPLQRIQIFNSTLL